MEQKAFDQLKHALTTSPVLIYPSFERLFLLQMNASNNTVGAILSQTKDGHEQVVAYASCYIRLRTNPFLYDFLPIGVDTSLFYPPFCNKVLGFGK